MDARLSPIYGVAPPAGGKMTAVDLPPAERPGLLSEPGLLAMLAYEDQTNPIKRGELVRAALLCQELPSPPANLVVSVPPPRPGTTTRQRFVQHRADPACAGCHELLDPVGLGLEAYDAVGRRRSTDGGAAIDDSGMLVAAEGIEGPFRGLRELAERLTRSPAVRACVAKQWFRYLSGRREGERDRCTVEAGVQALAANGDRLAAVIPALVSSPGFERKRAE